jgi:hypothetical protein
MFAHQLTSALLLAAVIIINFNSVKGFDADKCDVFVFRTQENAVSIVSFRFVSFSSKKAYRFPITTIDVSFYSYYSLFSLYSKSYGSTYCIVFVSFRFLPKKRIVFVLSLSFGFTHIIFYFFSLLLATYFLLFLLSCGAKLRKYCFVLFHWFFFVLSLSCFILLIYFFLFSLYFSSTQRQSMDIVVL